MHDFVISVSTQHPSGNEIKDFKLSEYEATPEETSYKVMRKTIVRKYEMENVQWVSVALTMNNQYICIMKGSLNWLNSIEYFAKFVGTAVDNFQQASFGFIDSNKGIRVEFENGAIVILQQ